MTQTILAVDDEPHMLKLLERIISEKTSYRITTTNNSLEIPELLKRNQFELIISDLKMPGMDGMDVLRYVKDNNRPEAVIIMTAFGSMESAVDALQHGVFDYITKPFKKEQIIVTVDRAMRWQEIRTESSRMSQIFEMKPYDRARRAFDREYVQRLAARMSMNIAKMVEHSGLTDDFITATLKDSQEGDK